MEAWEGRLRDAQGFWDLATMVADDLRYSKQAVSSAVLAAIAANDAICLYLGYGKPAGDSHTEAAQTLQEACKGTRHEEEAARRAEQLTQVLRHKAAAQYLAAPLSAEVAARTLKQAERFLKWAESVLEE